MTRRTRDTLRENVIIAAREFDKRQSSIAAGELRVALQALDDHEAAVITGSGAKSVKGAPHTSADAAGLAEPVQYSARTQIVELLDYFLAHGGEGMTDDAMERRLGRSHQTVSSARNWLVDAGWVRDSGKQAVTRSNRMAVVWELTPMARQQLRQKGGA